MKHIALSLFLVCSASHAMAQDIELETKEQLVHTAQHKLAVELNENTVLCSDAGYGAHYLKVLIPQLGNLTLLNHRNFGAAAPCVAAGMCRDSVLAPNGRLPSDIIDAPHSTAEVVLTVEVVRVSQINHKEKTCHSQLVERVNVPIRGVTFTHVRSSELDDREYEDCL